MVLVASAAPATVKWPKPTVITAPLASLRDVALALGPGNEVALGWSQTQQPQDAGIYESGQPPTITPRAWFPLIRR